MGNFRRIHKAGLRQFLKKECSVLCRQQTCHRPFDCTGGYAIHCNICSGKLLGKGFHKRLLCSFHRSIYALKACTITAPYRCDNNDAAGSTLPEFRQQDPDERYEGTYGKVVLRINFLQCDILYQVVKALTRTPYKSVHTADARKYFFKRFFRKWL